MAGVALSFVDDLNSTRNFWNMKARIIRVWKQSFRWDMIVVDERGSKIQGIIRNQLTDKFAEHIKEDVAIVIKNFGVADQMDKHWVINRDRKINFFGCTEVTPVSDFTGHPYAFNFISFRFILDNDVPEGSLTVDIIGRLAWIGKLELFKKNGKQSKRIYLDVEDLGGVMLRCTMWGPFAEQCNNFAIANQDSMTELKMIIIQHGRVKEWAGDISVQNDMYATRIFLDEDIAEANDLRRSFILRDGPTTSLTVLSSQTAYPLRDEFVFNTPRKHVDEVMIIEEEMSCIVVGTIKSIEEQFGWFYKAHRKCNKKVFTKTEYMEHATTIPDDFEEAPVESMWCLKCGCMADSLIPKFKVQFRVQDSTGSVSFVMFDKDVSHILGLKASDIRDRQVESKNLEAFPFELHALQDKKLAFKITLSQYNMVHRTYHVYTVSKICDDPDVIQELEKGIALEESNTPEDSVADAVNLNESSQHNVDSKDCASVTGSSKPTDVDKDSATSPGDKRPIPFDLDEKLCDDASASKVVKKKLE